MQNFTFQNLFIFVDIARSRERAVVRSALYSGITCYTHPLTMALSRQQPLSLSSLALLLFSLAEFNLCSVGAVKELNILFVGNSLTYVSLCMRVVVLFAWDVINFFQDCFLITMAKKNPYISRFTIFQENWTQSLNLLVKKKKNQLIFFPPRTREMCQH